MERIPALDGIRGLAILLVLVFHLIGDREFTGVPVEDGILMIARSCWIGVDCFFVLSGFLITSILLRCRSNEGSMLNFYARRALRIFPLYYLWVAFYLVLFPYLFPTGADDGQGSDMLLWFYLTNFKGHSHGASHLWSLAIEEQFYLIWPLLVYRFSERGLLRIIGCALVAAIGLRGLILSGALPLHPIKIYTLPFTHGDGLLIGSALAILRGSPICEKILLHRGKVFAASASLLLVLFLAGRSPSFWSNPLIGLLGYTSSALCFAIIILQCLGPKGLVNRIFTHPFFLIFGKYSYFIYLFHFPVTLLARRHMDTGPWLEGLGVPSIIGWLLETALVTGVVLIGGIVSWRIFEGPILSLKSYFPQSGGFRGRGLALESKS